MARVLTDGGGYYSGGGGSGGTSGTTSSGGSADPIAGQFSRIRNIIGTPTGTSIPSIGTGGPTPSFPAGPTSSDILRQGINLVGGQGVNLSNLGNLLLGTGVGTLQQPFDFYSKLLSGDPTTMTQALAPTASTISQLYQPLITNAQQNLPRGGFSAATAAELPFAEAGQIGNAALALQPQAASALEQLGLDVSKLGLGEQAAGQQGIQDIIQAALGKMGVTTSITANLGNILGALI
jgi:hypothetical protein